MAIVNKLSIGGWLPVFSKNTITWHAQCSLVILLSLWGYIFAGTINSIVISYWQFPLNQHCVLILPLFLGLILTKKNVFLRIAPAVSRLGLLLLLCGVCLSSFALVTKNELLSQASVLALVPVIFMLTFGRKISKALIFPFCYLLLLLPIGTSVIPYLKANIVHGLVQACAFSNLAVFWDEQSIHTVYSNINFATFGEGLDFILVFFAIGCIYAYCVGRNLFRRIIVATTFLLFPVVSIFIGAYCLIRYELTVGHAVTNMQSLTNYGWGLIIVGLFASISLGWFLKERKPYYDSLTSVDWKSNWRYADIQWFWPTIIAAIILCMTPWLPQFLLPYC